MVTTSPGNNVASFVFSLPGPFGPSCDLIGLSTLHAGNPETKQKKKSLSLSLWPSARLLLYYIFLKLFH